MKKTAILTDSNSGISQQLAGELGVYVVPMPFTINGVDYNEGIDLSTTEFYSFLTEKSQIFTSQPAIGALCEIWDSILKDYEEILFIPMSSSLSGTYQSAKMLADQEYTGKVIVADTQRIAVMLYQDVLHAINYVNDGKTANEIKDILEANKANNAAYLIVPTLEYLKRGGRVTASAAALGSLLKIKPVLQLKGGKIDSYEKVRTENKAYSIMVDAINKDIADANLTLDQVNLFVVHTNCLDKAIEFRGIVQDSYLDKDIQIMDLSLSVACHVGPNVVALAYAKK